MGYSQLHLRDPILTWFKGTNLSSPPATFYVALLTTNPSDENGTGLAEVVNGAGAGQWNGYARQSIAATTGWSAISGTVPRQISNAAILNYGTASISSGTVTVTGFAIYDAVTVGTFYGWVALTGGSLVVNNTDTFTVPIGSLVVDQ